MTETTSKEYNGFLFVLEGIDGSGKTCACKELEKRLESVGYDVVRLREPTHESKWGLEIKERSPRGELSPEEELELYSKDREWHITNKILPALKEGKIVLMDRYFFASGAYQSTVLDLHWSKILAKNRDELSAPEPDIVFILDVPAEIGMERTLARTGKAADLQFERLDRLVKVRKAYLEMFENDSATYELIDSTNPLEQVIEQIYKIILNFMKKTESEAL